MKRAKRCICGLPMAYKQDRWKCYPCERRQRKYQHRNIAYENSKALNKILQNQFWKISYTNYYLVIDQISRYTPRSPTQIIRRVQETTKVSDRLVYKALEVGLIKGDIKRDGARQSNGRVHNWWGGGYLLV